MTERMVEREVAAMELVEAALDLPPPMRADFVAGSPLPTRIRQLALKLLDTADLPDSWPRIATASMVDE